jgi:glutamine cyclotransferase
MSDGTATLHFLDPDTLQEIGRVSVHDAGSPVGRLNELEYVEGEVYANVWQTDRIARIDPKTGRVTAWIDLTGLLQPEDFTPVVTPSSWPELYVPPADVLNGIAYDPEGGRLFVTGKLWPKVFEIELTLAEQ